MPREQEIALALSAGPAHFAEEAGVYVLEKSGYLKIRESKNGFHCFVGRSVPGSQEPECYDAEGSETRMKVELFEGDLRMQGKSRKEIEQAVAAGYASGRFRAPRRPGIVYMLSKENRLPIDEEGKTVLPYRPHLMFYAPYLSNADIGAKAGPGAPAFVLDEGTPGALIIVPVPVEESGASSRQDASNGSGSAQEKSESGGRLIRLTQRIGESQSNFKEKEIMAGKVKAIPDGYHSITPYLVVRGAAKAIDYYQRAFGAKERFRMPGPGGSVAHAEIDIGDSVVMLSDENPEQGAVSPEALKGSPASVFLYVEDVDKTFAQAVKAGAKAVMPPEDMFWGDRFGKLIDPFGHNWALATHKEDVSPEEMEKRMAQMFSAAPK
ncbi:MAG TPA: VOC family protein [Terriglobales bacterium]|nr:VOC family protein [Terriglobales bacterium]